MKVTIEMIDELRSRVNVSYEEARRVLEENDGDLVKAIIQLETKKGVYATGTKPCKKEGFKNFMNKVLKWRFSVKNRNDETLINIPLVGGLLVLLLAFWVVIISLIIFIFNSCKIRIYKMKDMDYVECIKNNVKETTNKMKESTSQVFKDTIDVNDLRSDNNKPM